MRLTCTRAKQRVIEYGCLVLLGVLCLTSCGDVPSSSLDAPVADSSVEIIIHPNGSQVDARVVSTEVIPQNNCGGTSVVTNSIERSLAVIHTVEMGGGLEVSAGGGVGIPGLGQVDVGVAVSAYYGKSFGTQSSLSRGIQVSAKEGTYMEHTVQIKEVWRSGEVEIRSGDRIEFYPFKFRDDMILELIGSENLGCDPNTRTTRTAQATPIPTPVPVLSSTPVPTSVPTEDSSPRRIPTPEPTPTPTPPPTQIVEPYIGQAVTALVPVADIWPNPRVGGDQERETQILMGEQVEITEIREDWYRVVVLAQASSKDPKGYPGWIRAHHVTLRPYEINKIIIVMIPSAYLRESPDPDSSILAEISLDTRLSIVQEETGWLQVELPDGDRAWIDASQVRVDVIEQSSYVPSPEDLVRTAKALLGVRYMWGGSSWQALDCSGVVYRTFHAHGILLARDSQDQAQGGKVVAREDLQPGDLVFYAVGGPSGTVSHVGLYIGDGLAIATYDGQNVMIRPYDDRTYTKEFWGARRYW